MQHPQFKALGVWGKENINIGAVKAKTLYLGGGGGGGLTHQNNKKKPK